MTGIIDDDRDRTSTNSYRWYLNLFLPTPEVVSGAINSQYQDDGDRDPYLDLGKCHICQCLVVINLSYPRAGRPPQACPWWQVLAMDVSAIMVIG
jgi:hypothetical protein